MANSLNRRDYYSAIPQLEKQLGSLSQYVTVSEGKIQIKINDLYGKELDLELSVDGVTSRVSDAEGNISTLQQTATSLGSRITNAEGDISVLEQTATSFGTRITAAETAITGIAGDIEDIEGDIVDLNTGIDDIDAVLSGTTGLINRVSTAETAIQQNANAIALKANASDVYTEAETDALLAEYTKTADFSVAPDQIQSVVTAAITTAEAYTDGALVSYVTGTTLTQTVNSIEAEITEKATVFTSQPTPPYTVGDLWVQGPNGNIYKCKTTRSSGNYSSSDWELASNYTDDTTASSAYSLANGEVTTRTTLIRASGNGTLTAYKKTSGDNVGVHTNASGSVDIVPITWSNGSPTIGTAYATYGASTISLGKNSTSAAIKLCGDNFAMTGKTGQSGTYGGNELYVGPTSNSGQRYIKIGTQGTVVTSDASWIDVGYGYSSGDTTYFADICAKGSQILLDSATGVRIKIPSASSNSGPSFGLIWGSTSMMNFYRAENTPVYRLRFPHSYSLEVSGSTLKMNDNGTIGASGSRRSIKDDITYDLLEENNPRRLYDLQIAQFKYKASRLGVSEDAPRRNYVGFIAEDVNDVYPVASCYMKDGTVADWDERVVLPAMLKLIQEQNERIKVLEAKIA